MELQLSRTASDILSEFEAVIIDTAKIKLFSAENEASSKTSVSLDTPLVIIADFGHRYLKFFLQDDGTNTPRIPETVEGKRNAFTTLIASQEAVHLPPKKQSTKNNFRLYNSLVDILEGHGTAFRPHEVEMATSMTQRVANALWHIQGNHHNFEEMSIRFPKMFTRDLLKDVVDHKERHKAPPRVSPDVFCKLYYQ